MIKPNIKQQIKIIKALEEAVDKLGIAAAELHSDLPNFYIEEWDTEHAQVQALALYNTVREFTKNLAHYFECVDKGVDPWLN